MRNYIFTKRERKLIDGFLNGEVTVSNVGFSQLVHRVKRSSRLMKDIDLYRRFREAITTVST